MTALSKERNTYRRSVDYETVVKLADTYKVYNGGMVMEVAGYSRPAADTSGGVIQGVAYETVDNGSSVTGHADGFVSCPVRMGVFEFATSGGSAITQADVGKLAYVLDDQTVVLAAGTSNNVIAGKILGLNPDTGQVIVDMRQKTL